MSAHYKNFKTVVYLPAWEAARLTKEKLEKDYAFLEKYIGLDKVYLETYRDRDVPEERLRLIKDFLEEKGVEVSGGITTTSGDFEGAEGGKRRLFNTLCYSDPAMRERIKKISEYTAGIFDEIILDDFYFTNCSCERCIQAKGDRDWVTFRRELMKDVSENLIVGPAKKINPKAKLIVKYPNWRESYHFTGYVPEEQEKIFDATYIGTETRSPAYTDQHLPEYLSYMLVRYMDNAWQGRCGGGWFDPYQCWSSDRYLEQAYLTAFAQAKELMHFQWGDLIENRFVTAMGMQLKKIDEMMEGTGKACGIPVYLPYASCGENHLEMRLGMLGFPMEAVNRFPGDAPKLFLTKSALADKEILGKLEKYVRDGGDAVITTGFLAEVQDELKRIGLTEARLTGKKYTVTRYHVTGDYAGYLEQNEGIVFPELLHGNNESWSLLNGGEGDLHTSLLLRSTYGKGRLYILSIPDHDSDLYKLPREAVDVCKRVLTGDDYVSGTGFSSFIYDDGSFILYRYVKAPLRTERVSVHTRKKAQTLLDVTSGERIPATKKIVHEDFERHEEMVAELILTPGEFRRYRWE